MNEYQKMQLINEFFQNKCFHFNFSMTEFGYLNEEIDWKFGIFKIRKLNGKNKTKKTPGKHSIKERRMERE
jgi:hypothetical protein